MPLIDYFTAPSDTDAARVHLGSGGPATLGFDTVSAKGIDPAVALGNLESIMTDRPYEEVVNRSRQCDLLTDDEEDALVVTVTDTLRDALAAAHDERRRHTAEQWAATEELAHTTPEMLADFLGQFATLASSASERGHHHYCWWAL